MMPTQEQVDRAWGTLGQREEGKIIKAHFFGILTRVAPEGADSSALRDIEAERRFARKILALMGTNLDDPEPADIDRTAAGLGAARTAARRAARRGPASERRSAARRGIAGDQA